jgi:hypothetical protein
MGSKERLAVGMMGAVILIWQEAAAADGWNFRHDSRDHPEITFVQSMDEEGVCPPTAVTKKEGWNYVFHECADKNELTFLESGKTVFFLGCGHAVGFHVMYPGQSRPGGPVTIYLSNSKIKLSYIGELEMGFDDEDDQTPYVVSWNLGLDQGDEGVIKKVDELLSFLTSPEPFTIAAENGSYKLPPLRIPNVKARFKEDC